MTEAQDVTELPRIKEGDVMPELRDVIEDDFVLSDDE